MLTNTYLPNHNLSYRTDDHNVETDCHENITSHVEIKSINIIIQGSKVSNVLHNIKNNQLSSNLLPLRKST
jgi:hypothetical protein